MTETPGTVYTALLAVQGEVSTLPKDATNPHFRSKYTPLNTIVEHVGPVLNKHGLVWTALPIADGGRPALRYSLVHAVSDTSIQGTMPLLLIKEDPQGFGSALTYARRYALCSVLNLVADDDDDGNAAAPAQAQPRAQQAAPAAMTPELYRQLSEAFVALEATRKDELLQTKLDELGAKPNGNLAQRIADLDAATGRTVLAWMRDPVTPEAAAA